MESGVSLADLRKEENLKANCIKLGIGYIAPDPNETEDERDARHRQLQLAIRTKRRLQNEAQQSPDKKRRLRDNNADAQRRRRGNFSPEQQESERRNNTASRQQQRANLSPEQQASERRNDTIYRQQQRANLTPEQQENERRNNTASRQQQRANLTPGQQESERRHNTESRRRQREIHQVDNNDVRDSDDSILDPPTKEHIESLVQDAIKQVKRTMRADGKHQATVCVVCDRLITGEEKVCLISKERLEKNRSRLSVQSYEDYFGQMHPLLIQQYVVEDLGGMLLSPRSYRDGDNFECLKLVSRAKQSLPGISQKFLSVRPSVRPSVMDKNQTFQQFGAKKSTLILTEQIHVDVNETSSKKCMTKSLR
mmetsp:Transcript_21610/g.33878  ORF Transcript_21610/g.33878 Transcript_21610/m.33878 type:complete len:368 (+) Transcript_21610:693-1796(+)